VHSLKPLFVLLAVAALLAAPHAALAQSAGDDQYTDPFANGDQPADDPGAGGGTEGEGSQDQGGSPDDGASLAESEPELSTDNGTPTGSLPRTGFPVLLVLASGYVLLLAGTVIRRRLR
jgi:hypothetical protein